MEYSVNAWIWGEKIGMKGKKRGQPTETPANSKAWDFSFLFFVLL